MKRLCLVALVSAFALSPAALAAGATVTNMDQTDHILILEDAEENTTEVTIAPGSTLRDMCNECFIYIKGSEDFEYIEGSTVFAIQGGRLVPAKS
jgi:hypothetical protein